MQRYLQGNYKFNFKVALKNIGDKTTKPARNEPELNFFNPKDNRDTSTPRQMVKNLQVYIFGDILSDDKKKLLIDWMSDNSITDTLIKAETPQGWKVIDKSGSGDYGARNDIAVIYPPNRKPKSFFPAYALISVPSLKVTRISSLLYTVMKSTRLPHSRASNSLMRS